MPLLAPHQSDPVQTLLFKMAYNLSDAEGIKESIVTAFTSLSDEQKTAIATALSVTPLVEICGEWNADTNTPTLTSGQGDTGNVFIVSVAGDTLLDGLAGWEVGDMVMFSGSAWLRVSGATVASATTELAGIVTLASTGEAAAGVNTSKVVTPAGVKAYVDGLGIKNIALTGSYNDLLDKPTLFSGSYSDLTNKPTIPNITGTTTSTSTLLGTSQVTTVADYNVLIGSGIIARTDGWAAVSNPTAVGYGATLVGDYATAVGNSTKVGTKAIAMGYGAYAGAGSITLSGANNTGNNGTGGSYSGRIELLAHNGSGSATARVAGVPNGTIFHSFAVTNSAPTDSNTFDSARHGDLEIPRRTWGLRVNTSGAPIIDINNAGVITSVAIPTSSLTGGTGSDSVWLGQGQADSGNWYTSIGWGTQVTNRSTAVGFMANATGDSACAFGAYATGNSDRAIALGYQAQATGQNSISIGSCLIGNSVNKRVEICPRANSGDAITNRLSGQANGDWQFTAVKSDSAPPPSIQAFGNTEGTLPTGMYRVRFNTSNVPVIDYNTDGTTVVSTTIPAITGVTGANYSYFGSSITGVSTNKANLFGSSLNGQSADRLNAFGTTITFGSATAATGSSAFGDNIAVNGTTAGNACVFGRSANTTDGGSAFGAYASAKLSGVAVGQYTGGGDYSLSLGYYAANGTTVTNRTEIAPTNNGTITHRLTGQANGAWQYTFPVTDTAPTTVAQAFGNADGTLPQGMAQLRMSVAGIPTIDQNIGGTIKSTPVSHRQIVDINAQTGTTYTTVAADAGKVVTLANASAITVTLSALPAGSRCVFEQLGAGQVTFAAGAGNTLRHVAGLSKIAGQWGRVWCRVSSNGTDYILSGDMA